MNRCITKRTGITGVYQEQFEVYSTGTTPQSEGNSFSIEVLTERGTNVEDLKPMQLDLIDRCASISVVNVYNNDNKTCGIIHIPPRDFIDR